MNFNEEKDYVEEDFTQLEADESLAVSLIFNIIVFFRMKNFQLLKKIIEDLAVQVRN